MITNGKITQSPIGEWISRTYWDSDDPPLLCILYEYFIHKGIVIWEIFPTIVDTHNCWEFSGFFF